MNVALINVYNITVICLLFSFWKHNYVLLTINFVPQTTYMFGMTQGWPTSLTLKDYIYLSRREVFCFVFNTDNSSWLSGWKNDCNMTISWKTCAISTTQSLLFQVKNAGNITDGRWVCMIYLFWVQGHFSSNEKPFSQKHYLIFPVSMDHTLILKIYLFAPFALDHQHLYLK